MLWKCWECDPKCSIDWFDYQSNGTLLLFELKVDKLTSNVKAPTMTMLMIDCKLKFCLLNFSFINRNIYIYINTNRFQVCVGQRSAWVDYFRYTASTKPIVMYVHRVHLLWYQLAHPVALFIRLYIYSIEKIRNINIFDQIQSNDGSTQTLYDQLNVGIIATERIRCETSVQSSVTSVRIANQ